MRRALSGWELRLEDEAPDPRAGVELDIRLAREVARGEAGPTYRIWRNPRALIVTARERRLPRFGRAAREMQRAGWPVVARESGGTAIPHEPGFVQLSLALPYPRGAAPGSPPPPYPLEEVYRALAAPARIALQGLGVLPEFGHVPGSFCDGRFNLVARGRKLAGTSQRWRARAGGGTHGGYILAHMTLFVEGDMATATRAVNRFQELADGKDRFDPEASGTVEEALTGAGRRPGAPGDLRAAVTRALAQAVESNLGAAWAPR
jgi:octanoyl-[GcvH]:protein N-octanoyltransferase